MRRYLRLAIDVHEGLVADCVEEGEDEVAVRVQRHLTVPLANGDCEMRKKRPSSLGLDIAVDWIVWSGVEGGARNDRGATATSLAEPRSNVVTTA